MPIRTYVDSGVLIFAAQGTSPSGVVATSFITDANREYVTSDYVKLEVMPQATFHKRTLEVEFYERFFAMSIVCIPPSPELMAVALAEACKIPLKAIDALHVAAARAAGAEELITAERNTSLLYSTKLVKVVSIFA